MKLMSGRWGRAHLPDAVIAVIAAAAVGCSATSKPPSTGVAGATPKQPASQAAVRVALREYYACGSTVISPAGQADCVAALLAALDSLTYPAQVASAAADARASGDQFRDCLARVKVGDLSNCDAARSTFYAALTRLDHLFIG